MNKVIPIMPCPNIREQADFYQHLGFEVAGIYTAPNAYVALRYGEIELHFWGSKRNVPEANPTMCFLQVDDVDAICQAFSAGLKQGMGKIPRSGIPRITKVRDLKDDRRFTLTDPGGNTLFVGTPVNAGAGNFYRDLESEEHGADFKILYDLLYSKEDPKVAANMLPRLVAVKASLNDLDRAKLLLVEMDIQQGIGNGINMNELRALLAAHAGEEGWKKIEERAAVSREP